jgi:hypothetical protein
MNKKARGYNPIREGREAGLTRDPDGKIVAGRVVWTETATYNEMEKMFEQRLAGYAIVRNNTNEVLLVTDEEHDWWVYAEDLLREGVTDWHMLENRRLYGQGMEKIEPEDTNLYKYIKNTAKPRP